MLIKQVELFAQCTFTSSINASGPVSVCAPGNISLISSAAGNNWTQKASFGGTAREYAVAFSIGNKAYLGTGNDGGTSIPLTNDFWEFDPINNVWTQKASFPGTARSNAIGFAIANKGYIGTGYDFSTEKNDFWEYDPLTNLWVQKANYPHNTSYAVGFAIGNKGYIGIGFGSGTYYDDFWEYDPASDTWSQKSYFLGVARTYAVGFSIGNKGYIGTGDDGGSPTDEFWEYDPLTDSWIQKTNFGNGNFGLMARGGAVGFSVGGMGYIGTGFNGAFKNDFWEYNPANDTWTQKANFGGVPRDYASAFSVGGKGYVGMGDNGTLKNDLWEYNPSYSYLWSNNATTNSITVNVTGSYSVIVTTAGGCTSIASQTVNINPAPIINIANGAICSGASYTITPIGANSYTFSGGSNIVSPISNVIYTVTGSDSNGCVGSALCSVTVDSSVPSLTITGTNNVCLGSSTNINAIGAITYSWSTGALTANLNVSPTSNTTYTVDGTNGCGTTTQTITVTVDNTCADVWPGDANSDGSTDNLDVLELGLHYTQTGAPRASVSNSWQSYFANNWTGTITNGSNLNHSDCNGDGVIDANDTLAIYNNYGLTHAFKPAQTTTVNPQLSIVPDQAAVVKGTWGTASVYLGDATTNINNINGVAFTVDFDNTLIEPNSIWLEYQNSFMDAGQNLHFQKPDFANSKLYTASTHTASNNVSGFGKIATLHYQILSSLATDEVLNIGVSQAYQSDASGTISPLTTGAGTLMAIGASVGIKENSFNGNILITPNPTNGLLNISFNTIPQNTKIEVYNSIGALVLSETMINKNNTINISDLSSGIYFMKVLEGNKVVAVKKVVRE